MLGLLRTQRVHLMCLSVVPVSVCVCLRLSVSPSVCLKCRLCCHGRVSEFCQCHPFIGRLLLPALNLLHHDLRSGLLCNSILRFPVPSMHGVFFLFQYVDHYYVDHDMHFLMVGAVLSAFHGACDGACRVCISWSLSYCFQVHAKWRTQCQEAKTSAAKALHFWSDKSQSQCGEFKAPYF